MKVSDQFDREYDQDKYEKKIARLIRHARNRAQKEDPHDFEAWKDAIHTLGREDHYLLTMVSQAGISVRPRGDLLKLWGPALAVVCIGIPVAVVADRSVKLSPASPGAFSRGRSRRPWQLHTCSPASSWAASAWTSLSASSSVP